MTTLSDAKPCPFCGSTRIVKGERYFAMCVDCGATGPERNADASVRKFTGDWNTRNQDRVCDVLGCNNTAKCELFIDGDWLPLCDNHSKRYAPRRALHQ